MNICRINPKGVVEQVAICDPLDEIRKDVFDDQRNISEKSTNRLVRQRIVEATLNVE